ncbi:hypothetical protein GCM10027361_26190 [Erwinia aphidicola]|uniref:hypothetical protein n=1 Tax=Erwinia aphidicola TaxID=68334 RepID=UPI001747A112|nr:hypothetical protein [Erwinia aphidicola]MBD1378313.1 hypothetical protein [Erwinia aphidicola]
MLSLLFLRVFLTLEKRTIQPLLDLHMLRNKDFAAACMLSVLLAIFYCSAFMLIPLRLVAVFQPSDARIGLMLLPVTLVMAVVSPIAGHAADRFTPWPVMAAGFIALSLSALLQSFGNIPITTVFAAFILMGAGWGAILGPSVNAALCLRQGMRRGLGFPGRCIISAAHLGWPLLHKSIRQAVPTAVFSGL